MASDPLAKFGEVLYRKQILRLLSLRFVADTAPFLRPEVVGTNHACSDVM